MEDTAQHSATTPPRPRWVRAAVAGFVAFELAAGAFLLRHDTTEPPSAFTPGTELPATITARPRQDSADRSAALRTAAVEDLLARRARAIRTRDRALFESTLDPHRPNFRARQRRLFDALKDVPLADWRYDVDTGYAAPDPPGYAGETWSPRVTLRYRLRGFDPAPAQAEQWFTFVRRGDAWLIASDSDFDGTAHKGAKDLWDFGPVTVVRGRSTLVLGHPGDEVLLRDVARRTDEAIPRVSETWGTKWGRKVVVVVPSTQAEVGKIIGDNSDLTRIAAVAVSGLPEGATSPIGNRVIVNPPNFRRLGPVGRRVVLTHEVTHVATRDAGVRGAPTWVIEGFADYVGYLGTGLSARVICQELAQDVRAGRVPAKLPADDAFDGANDRLAQAYESSWLAVHLIAERAGERGLVRFYRRVAGGEALSAVLRDVVGLTPAQFTREWRRYVRRTLG